MDTTDKYIKFDSNGVCNHCKTYDRLVKERVLKGKEGEEKLQRTIQEIKDRGKGKQYDCIIGLSGGIDSTYVAYLVKKLGLRPLAVSLDNGYDTEISRANVQNVVKRLNLDFLTYAVDWEEFKDLQLAYLKAAVLDLETPTDNVLTAMFYEVAKKNNLKYLITGYNIITEGIMPTSWNYSDDDILNMKAIHKQFGTREIKNLPTIGLYKKLYYEYILGIKQVTILNMIPYVKKNAKEIIIKELGWMDYGSKHHESIYTRFYQAYILPKRFYIDKRRAHLSALISSGQLTREKALQEIQKSPYTTEEDLRKDKEYVLRKLGLTDEEFEKFMSLPVRSHLDFQSDIKSRKILRFMYQTILGRSKGQ
jgi:N-acetyl sugar amidotransferase